MLEAVSFNLATLELPPLPIRSVTTNGRHSISMGPNRIAQPASNILNGSVGMIDMNRRLSSTITQQTINNGSRRTQQERSSSPNKRSPSNRRTSH